MREYSLSNCEKGFIQKAVAEGYRLDGRNYNESRKLHISFGNDYGSCLVSLGETKVLGQVSCEVVQPKQIRPNEGILYINVEISPMAAQHFEANRQTDLSVYLNRLLEKCYKDSKCIDLESLCIVVEEKVWSLRVDIKVLNHEGNIIECASIATLAALAHFRRPDVTRSGDNTIIHTIAEKDPIPTVLYHYPICLTFAIFGNSIVVSDPSFMEELVCTSSTEEGLNTGGVLLVIGMNQYREICLMDLTGSAIFNANLVHKATLNAANRCKDVVDMIKQSIASDNNLRQKRDKVNFSKIITDNHILSLSKKELNIQLRNYEHEDVNMGDSDAEMEKLEEEINEEFSKYSVLSTKPQTAETVSTTQGTKWLEVSSDSED